MPTDRKQKVPSPKSFEKGTGSVTRQNYFCRFTMVSTAMRPELMAKDEAELAEREAAVADAKRRLEAAVAEIIA